MSATESQPIIIDSPKGIDLNQHGVIEASAGTGKTYTIENMVIRLLLETENRTESLTLENILVLTFTEKATGELRARVREKINEKIKDLSANEVNNHQISLLKQNLSLFDKAAIYTIHGFCQRVLQDYPFETEDDFKSIIVDDSELYPKLLSEIMRQWPQQFGNKLPEILQLINFSSNGDWEKKVLSIATSYHPDSGDIILPDSTNKDSSNINKTFKTITKKSKLLQAILSNQQAQTQFMEQALAITDGRSKNTFKKHLQSLFSCIDSDSILSLGKTAEKYIIKPPKTALKKATRELADKTAEIANIVTDLKNLKKEIKSNLTKTTIIKLQKKALLYKQEKGLLSFDDMIMRVDKALKKNSALCSILNKQFRYGLIDEFQDTDPRQWNIFKNIFLNPTNGKSKLFIIGDPKQAIYSFRGAELTTYSSAKEELISNQKANHYSLATNYRSTKEVIAGINDFFRSGWFEDLNYPEIKAPSDDKIFSENIGPQQIQKSVIICQDDKNSSVISARFNYAIFVAQEVQRLLDNPPTIIIKGKKHTLQPDDIAIIVRAKSNYKPIEDQFKAKKIPYSIYKKGGLYDSSEAKKILILLQTLAEPFSLTNFRKLLLTDFFSGSLNDLEDFSEISPDSPLLAILNRWQKIASQQEWGKLFRMVLEESGMLERKLNQDLGFERSISNYEQIFEGLLLAGKSNGYDIQALYEKLKFLIFQRKLKNEDSDLHRLESEKPKVQLMTIHTSKGLEFPIVFTLGGYFGKFSSKFYKFHDSTNNHQLIFDLNKEAENEAKAKQEDFEENKRLVYVAITRASHRIYHPYFPELKSQKPLWKLYLQRIADNFINNNNNNQPQERVTIVSINNLSDKETGSTSSKTSTAKNETPEFTLPDKLDNSPNFDKLSRRATFLKSFSSLHFEEEQEAAIEIGSPVKSPLPAGADSGNMLHGALEDIDFALVAKADSPETLLVDKTVRELLEQKIRHFIIKFDDNSERQKKLINEMIEEAGHYIYNALHSPIFPDSNFRLCDLTTDDRKHEMEFFYPLQKKDKNGEALFLDGFIDLVFKHEGKVYLLDWKSNSLGINHYLPEKLKDHVDHDYHDQYHIYAIAITRMLKAISPQEEFGGAVYLYLRGVDIKKPQQGIFYHSAKEMDLDEFATNLNKKREKE